MASSRNTKLRDLPPEEMAIILQGQLGAVTLGSLGTLLQPPQKKIPQETFRLAYKEYGDQIRHFSTVRSALATFLLTVSLATFAAYFNKSQTHPFLIAAGLIFSTAAIIACLAFSYRAEKAVLRYIWAWDYLKRPERMDVEEMPSYDPSFRDNLGRMGTDGMNWLLLFGSRQSCFLFGNEIT